MRTRFLLTLVFASVTASMLAFVASAQSPAENAIRDRLRAYAAASEKGWAERSKFYTEDADLWMSPPGKLVVGKPAMGQQLNQPLPPGMTFALDVERISVLSPDIATADAAYRVVIGDQKVGGHVFYVLVRWQGQWMIRSVRVMATAPPQ